MRAWLFWRLIGWCLLVLLFVLGMITMITIVEHGGDHRQLLSTVVPILLGLSPIVVAVGASLARVRAEQSGAALAWSAAGWGLPRTAPVVIAMGLFWGLGTVVVDQVTTSGWTPPQRESWTWVEHQAVGYGFQVQPDGERIQVRSLPRGWQGHSVASLGSPDQQGAMVVACVLFSLFGWWPIRRSAGVHLGLVLGLGIATHLCTIMLKASADAGQLNPLFSVWASPIAGMLLLLLLVCPRYFTRIQNPV